MANNNKTIKTRVQLKSDTEENWNKSVLVSDGGTKTSGTSFVPLLGELIVYIADATHPFSRLKVGDGETNVVRLPFIDAGTLNGELIPNDQVEFYNNYNAFPSEGQGDILYIDLATRRIYYYSTQYARYEWLSYTISRGTATYISNFSVGALPSMEARKGVLYFNTGTLPSMTKQNLSVVTDLT